MKTLKLKSIYQETIFLNYLGLSAQEVTKALNKKNVGTITTRHSTLIAKLLHPDEPQTMMRVVAKLNELGIISKLREKFATCFAKQIADAKQLPVNIIGIELVG